MTAQSSTLEIFNQFAKGDSAEKVVGNKCVIYTRVSTKDQADNNMSLVTQQKLC
jgi:site-specific DNA recombinase